MNKYWYIAREAREKILSGGDKSVPGGGGELKILEIGGTVLDWGWGQPNIGQPCRPK